MTEDARFEDGVERPLRLMAFDAQDLGVVSALVQDAVLTGADLAWQSRDRRLCLLINRFRWEDHASGGGQRHPAERVRSLLTIEQVQAVRSQGIKPGQAGTVLSLLSLEFIEEAAPSGRLRLIFAGDGEIELRVEAPEVALRDVSRPYLANSGHVPAHDPL